ncbi:MAG TPA: hypothetical protein VG078_00350 [Acidimicrobiales bacterium]|nr:hypothetical protein [Acidimicrobiales bacterium]
MLVLVAALALAATLLGACGGDDDGEDRGASTTVATTTATVAPTATATSGASTTGAGQGSATTRAATTLNCQTVAFTPNSEDAASSVTATGLSCAEAEAFVRVAGARTSPGGPAHLQVEGYRCVLVRSIQEPLPQAFYECTDGARRITFVRT